MEEMIQCEPEEGKAYMVEYVGRTLFVRVDKIFFLQPSNAKIAECTNLETNTTSNLLCNFRNHAVFYRSQKEPS